jgi:hypothetical protein
VQQRECPKYKECSASMCPLVGEARLKKLRGYFVDDDLICEYRNYATDPMVATQKKLKKAGATGLFTYQMLLAIEKVRAGIEGLPLSAAAGKGPYRKALQWIKDLKRKSG